MSRLFRPVLASSTNRRGTEAPDGDDGYGQHQNQRANQSGDPEGQGNISCLHNVVIHIILLIFMAFVSTDLYVLALSILVGT